MADSGKTLIEELKWIEKDSSAQKDSNHPVPQKAFCVQIYIEYKILHLHMASVLQICLRP